MMTITQQFNFGIGLALLSNASFERGFQLSNHCALLAGMAIELLPT